MSCLDSTTALLPLRGGSKGIPGKNIRPFLGLPLFAWSARAALDAGLQLVISTNDAEIERTVAAFTPEAKILHRPAHLASDSASTESVVDHAIGHISSEHILLLQATSPLTTAKHLTDAIAAYAQAGYRPLVTGTRQHHFYWNNDGTPANYDPCTRPRRQDWQGSFVENGAFYLFSRQQFLTSGTRCKPPCTLFEMEPIHAIEMDTLADWQSLEQLVQSSG